MIEFILPNTPSEALSPREIYFEITSRHIKVYQEVNQNIMEIFNLTNINWVCYKEYPCLPSELMNHYDYLKDSTLDINLIQATYTKIKPIIPNEKQCFAIEFFKNISYSDLTDKRIFCMSNYNEKIVEILQKAIVTAYHEAVKVMKFENVLMPLEYKNKYFIEYIAPGSNVVQSLHINFGEMGIEFEKETRMLYQSPDHCDFCYNVMEKLDNIHTINRCCLKMKKMGLESYICDQDAYRCDMNIKQIAKYLYGKCIDLNKNALDVHVPKSCLYEKKESLQSYPDLILSKNDFNMGNLLENYAEENIKSIRKAHIIQELIEKHLLRVNEEITKLNKNVISSEKNDGETINYNSDGSKTIIKANGIQIIQDRNNTINIIIRNDNTIEIIYFDGADYIIKGDGENIFTLPANVTIKIKQGNYEIESPEFYFNLQSNGSAFLHESDGKTTYIENDSKSKTILSDGTKISTKNSKKI